MMFGSYNKFHNKIHIDAAVVSTLDFFTSLIASCVIFSVLGFLATEFDVDIKDVAKGGQGLAFVIYPEALAKLPLPWLWSILFFFMVRKRRRAKVIVIVFLSVILSRSGFRIRPFGDRAHRTLRRSAQTEESQGTEFTANVTRYVAPF